MNGGTPNQTCTACNCPPGYTDMLCDADIDECTNNPCNNGSSCTNTPGSFICTCVVGYTGDICDVVNDCTTTSCQNGGICQDEVNGFQCECPAGFSGSTCETEGEEVSSAITVSCCVPFSSRCDGVISWIELSQTHGHTASFVFVFWRYWRLRHGCRQTAPTTPCHGTCTNTYTYKHRSYLCLGYTGAWETFVMLIKECALSHCFQHIAKHIGVSKTSSLACNTVWHARL